MIPHHLFTLSEPLKTFPSSFPSLLSFWMSWASAAAYQPCDVETKPHAIVSLARQNDPRDLEPRSRPSRRSRMQGWKLSWPATQGRC
ncbi:hypothetical protein C7974DRAFT_196835 [Boeremia exigua]|uniref:uncharacterized protein n=1 Tax=Boeremia exigua TaxID=749465 RepID=UPI001E8D080E|nr:uncharacterized protein C7974DRAFT_196835 [Boeremia exigua]KAH6625246.1 hypothetical protein C7974DRAFT_196835 [Boeremia exigua]